MKKKTKSGTLAAKASAIAKSVRGPRNTKRTILWYARLLSKQHSDMVLHFVSLDGQSWYECRREPDPTGADDAEAQRVMKTRYIDRKRDYLEANKFEIYEPTGKRAPALPPPQQVETREAVPDNPEPFRPISKDKRTSKTSPYGEKEMLEDIKTLRGDKRISKKQEQKPIQPHLPGWQAFSDD